MSSLLIEGGRAISGRIEVEGNKNAALPLLAACLLTSEECVLTNIKGDTIKCGCHQSEFSAKDGRVLNGPANRSLPKVDLKIEGENISIA